MAKILDFLRRYQGARYQRPTKADAQKLEDLLIFHSGKLTVPDLENEFSHLNAPDAIKRFLMGTVVTTSFPSFPSSTSSFGGTEGSFSGGSSSMPGERDDVPGPLQCSIANDLFLDLVTPSSHFQLCACPIRTVVQHATDRFQLVRSRGAFGRLLRFAEEVEKGYPDTNCEPLICVSTACCLKLRPPTHTT